MAVEDIQKALKKLGDKKKAKELQKFFKTGKGEYGEGDRFLGIKVPELRKLAKVYQNITLDEIETLLHSPIHEERLL
ncbi:MAG: DNA alkylation repair protein, partial [Pseudomonadota bacterium]